MKKKILLLVMLAVIVMTGIVCEESPMDRHRGNKTRFREQDGYAIVLGSKLHYWLYDTYLNMGGDWSEIEVAVSKWIESKGYIIDYDNITVYSPNYNLANSVKILMQQRGCDISVAFINENGLYPYVVLNSYDKDDGDYFTVIYPCVHR